MSSIGTPYISIGSSLIAAQISLNAVEALSEHTTPDIASVLVSSESSADDFLPVTKKH